MATLSSRSDFPTLVADELEQARRTHPGAFPSLHEAYAVLLEEVEEWWDEVKKKSRDRDRGKLLAELVQVAAMCQRTAEDLRLLEKV